MVWCCLCRQEEALKRARLTLCEVGVEFTNHMAAVCMGRTVPPADLLLIALIGKPVFRKVQARDHPLPCTVVTIQGICSVLTRGHGGLTETEWGVCLLAVELLSAVHPVLFSPDILLLIPGVDWKGAQRGSAQGQ